MSSALLTTRDAVTGYWNGEVTAPDPSKVKLPTGTDYLEKVSLGSQAAIADTLLKSSVSFEPVRNGCAVSSQGQELIRITRPSQAFFYDQLDWLRAYADLRGDRINEIFLQLSDLTSFFGAQCYLDSGRRKYSLMMLNLAQSFAIHLEIVMKYYCRAPRPIDLAQEVQPMIQTPDHSSFPSGHATEAFAVATVFNRLASNQTANEGIANRSLPFRLAHRIAANRTVAGVHFPVDSRAGAHLGCVAGEYVYQMATAGHVPVSTFDAGGKKNDFLLSNFEPDVEVHELADPEPIKVLKALWSKATDEWPV